MKSDSRFEMRIPSQLKESAEAYARQNGTSLAELIKTLLQRVISRISKKGKE